MVLQIDHSQGEAQGENGWINGTASLGKIHHENLDRLVLGVGWGWREQQLVSFKGKEEEKSFPFL